MSQPTAPPFASPEQTQEQRDSLSNQREVYARAENLLASPDFQWFFREGIKAALDKAQEDALDLRKTPAEREVAAHVRQAIFELSQWVEKRRDVARGVIQAP